MSVSPSACRAHFGMSVHLHTMSSHDCKRFTSFFISKAIEQGSVNQTCRKTLAHYMFLYGLQTKSCFYTFKWLEEVTRRVTFCGTWKLYKIQIFLMSINKILLEHSYPHLFNYHLWLLLCYNGRQKWVAIAGTVSCDHI